MLRGSICLSLFHPLRATFLTSYSLNSSDNSQWTKTPTPNKPLSSIPNQHHTSTCLHPPLLMDSIPLTVPCPITSHTLNQMNNSIRSLSHLWNCSSPTSMNLPSSSSRGISCNFLCSPPQRSSCILPSHPLFPQTSSEPSLPVCEVAGIQGLFAYTFLSKKEWGISQKILINSEKIPPTHWNV